MRQNVFPGNRKMMKLIKLAKDQCGSMGIGV